MPRRSWPHNLSAFMQELEISDRQLAALVEERPDYREAMRSRIVRYRGGMQMTQRTGQRFADGLTRAGRPTTVEELLDFQAVPGNELEQIREELAAIRAAQQGLHSSQARELAQVMEQLAIVREIHRLAEGLAPLPKLLTQLQELLDALEGTPRNAPGNPISRGAK